MRILIAGDLTLQDRAARCKWDDKQLKESFQTVRDVVGKCDHAIVNLESPVTTSTERILKDGPTLKNPLSVYDIIKYCGFDTVSLANNHLKDYGVKGVMDTLELSKKNELQTVGAGSNITKARQPLVLVSEEGLKVGIVNVCEHESSIATTNEAGANPLDCVNLYYDIATIKEKTDKVIVIVHGGREHYSLPTPRMRRDYHLIADYGADAIVNHHQHCFSGYEIYKGKPIFYGLGNFFFDRNSQRNDRWNYGFLLKLDIKKESIGFELLPYEQCNHEPDVRLLKYKDVELQIEEMNSIIANDDQLERQYDLLIKKARPLYPFIPFGGKLLRSLYYRGLLPRFISRKKMALIENAISCETHRDILLNYLNNDIQNE